MSKKYLSLISLATFVFSTSAFSITLKDSIIESLDTNPVVTERLRNFRATQQDLNIAESEYYPSIDIRTVIGRTDAGKRKDYGDDNKYKNNVIDETYNNYESSLTLTQNLFDGFGTVHKIDFEEARILAAAYNYVEKSNDIAFRMTSAYINVMRGYELLQTARENVQINETIFKKVQALLDSGLTTDSEVKKIQSALSLARSNYTVQVNNTRDSEYNFKRVLGRLPNVKNMIKPEMNIAMPVSIERAAMYAIEHNPSLIVSNYNIKGAQSLMKQRKKDYFPKIDLEISQFYNDSSQRNSFDPPDDRFRARLVLTYNIFHGGADRATIQKQISKVNQEVAIKRDLKRQVIEGLDLSWSAYEMIQKQLVDLRDYSKFSEETLKLYQDEYDLGRRSLLDLLSAQNDVINSRSQIITSEYELLFAKYRILDAMGLLVTSIVGDTKDYTSKVNLHANSNISDILDTVPVKLDVDEDNIADNIDLCDNSLEGNNILPYGCKKVMHDSDLDGIADEEDKCLYTPLNTKVSLSGCAFDEDNDGIKDYEDKCLGTEVGSIVDVDGCVVNIDDEVL